VNQTPKGLVYIVVVSLSGLAFLGLGSLCATLFWRNYVDPAVLTAIISMTSATVGAIGGILSSPRSAVTSTTTTTDADGGKTTTTKPVMLAPVHTETDPQPVVIKQPESDPVVRTEETSTEGKV